MNQRYVRASDLKSFSFCHRAWFLERQGLSPASSEDRNRGTVDHQNHSAAAQRMVQVQRYSKVLFLVGLVGLAAALLWWIIR
jgi:hypothetical protein